MSDSGRIFPVLLSGGAGSRLWPLSRENSPKQLIRIVGERTLFQQAVLRALDPMRFNPPIVITSEQHRFLVAEQMREVGTASGASIVLEPSPRNTAAPAAVAALLVQQASADGLLLLMPADHHIADRESFGTAVDRAGEAARKGAIALFGIKPTAPATAYGYIRAGEAISGLVGARRVAAFVEKPDRETAERYVASGDYLWNSGIFLVSARTVLKEFERHVPEILRHVQSAVDRATHDTDFLRLETEAFARCPSTSIDYAVMERTENAAVVPADFGWTDVGSWSTLLEIGDRGAEGNLLIGEVLAEATRDSYVRSEGPLVATVGVEGLIVVATPDAVLVAHKDHDQDIKKIVERLRDGNRGRT